MSNQDRRQFLRAALGNLLKGAGTVVLASSVVKVAEGQDNKSSENDSAEPNAEERANALAAESTENATAASAAALGFRRGAFRNAGFRRGGGVGGGFRNAGGFRRGGGGGGGFRRGGFRRG